MQKEANFTRFAQKAVQVVQTTPFILLSGFTSGYVFAIFMSYLWELSFDNVRLSYPVDKGQEWTNFVLPESTSTSLAGFLNNNKTNASGEFASVKILCWVMTTPSNHKTKAQQVKETWGSRCNKLLFMSSVYDPTLPSVSLDVEEGREHLWAKTKQSFDYVYRHHLQDADWFFKADDDTYAVMENMRRLLSTLDSEKRLFIGCHLKPFSSQGYMSGGAGYIVSKATLKLLIEKTSNGSCRQDDGGYEDVEIGKCLSGSGVDFVDGRDSNGGLLFHPYLPHAFVIPGRMNQSDTVWFLEYIQNPLNKGFSCCGQYPVTFHYVQPKMMKALEYMIYHVRPEIT